MKATTDNSIKAAFRSYRSALWSWNNDKHRESQLEIKRKAYTEAVAKWNSLSESERFAWHGMGVNKGGGFNFFMQEQETFCCYAMDNEIQQPDN